MPTIATPTVTVDIAGRGKFNCFTNTLDGVIAEYGQLPIEQLQKLTYDRTLIDFSDVRDHSALLVVIADYEGF